MSSYRTYIISLLHGAGGPIFSNESSVGAGPGYIWPLAGFCLTCPACRYHIVIFTNSSSAGLSAACCFTERRQRYTDRQAVCKCWQAASLGLQQSKTAVLGFSVAPRQQRAHRTRKVGPTAKISENLQCELRITNGGVDCSFGLPKSASVSLSESWRLLPDCSRDFHSLVFVCNEQCPASLLSPPRSLALSARLSLGGYRSLSALSSVRLSEPFS